MKLSSQTPVTLAILSTVDLRSEFLNEVIVSDPVHVGHTFNGRLKAVRSEFLNEVVVSDPIHVGHPHFISPESET